MNSVISSLIEKIIEGEVDKRELTGAFIFSNTPQGMDYWWNRVREKKPLSKTAKLHLKRIINAERRSGHVTI